MSLKKKVCIVSTSKVDNYGAVLQGAALKKTLETQFEPWTLNFESPELSRSNFPHFRNVMRTIAARLLFAPFFIKHKTRHKAFQKFRQKYLNLTTEYSSEELYKESFPEQDYQFFLSGSDQTFNTYIFGGKTIGFLDFIHDDTKKHSYAASFGSNSLATQKLKPLLERFSSILIREGESAAELRKRMNLSAQTVVDPIFLLNQEEWAELLNFKSFRKPKKPYILVYSLGSDENAEIAIKEFAKSKGLKIINIFSGINLRDSKCFGKSICPSPEEFVFLIANASYVYAKSFHGIAFSILFNTPFFHASKFGDTAQFRIKDLQSKFGIPNRSILGGKIIDNEIDWTAVNKNISIWRQHSITALFNSLNGLPQPQEEPKTVSTTKTIDFVGAACTGCEACSYVCPKHAISFRNDEEGFKYPVIDDALCVKCGLCLKACPTIQNKPKLGDEVFACHAKDANKQLSSSSGAIARTLYEYGLKNNYACFGVKWSDDFNQANYFKINCDGEIKLAATSKYIQTDKGDLYQEINDALCKQPILFIGLPCECAAIKNVFGNRLNKSIIVDLICHGPTSPSFLKKYLQEKGKSDRVTSLCLRGKDKQGYSLLVETSYQSGKSFKEKMRDTSFGKGMNYINRPSCSICVFRPGDLTIGDFWQLPTENKGYSKYGTSLVIPNNEKGREILSLISSTINCVPENMNLAKRGNHTLVSPTAPYRHRKKMLSLVLRGQNANKAYFKSLSLIEKAKMCVPDQIKRKIKKVLGKPNN